MTANILWLVIIFSVYDILWLFSTSGYSLKILKCFSTTILLQFLFSFSKLRRGCLFSSVDHQFPVQLENHNWDSTWKQGPWFLRKMIFLQPSQGVAFFFITPLGLVGGIGVLLTPLSKLLWLLLLPKIQFLNLKFIDLLPFHIAIMHRNPAHFSIFLDVRVFSSLLYSLKHCSHSNFLWFHCHIDDPSVPGSSVILITFQLQ